MRALPVHGLSGQRQQSVPLPLAHLVDFHSLLSCQQKCRTVSCKPHSALKGCLVEPKCPHGRAYKDRNGNFAQCSGLTTGLPHSSDKVASTQCPVNFQCFFDGSVWGCCPTKCEFREDRDVCSLHVFTEPRQGRPVRIWYARPSFNSFSGRSYRYYFNSNKQTCETFQYEGCDGNSNSS